MKLLEENILKTREYFANLCLTCIEDAKKGITHVNDLEAYIAWKTESYNKTLAGEYDHTLTHRQYATYLQTGICHPILPNSRKADIPQGLEKQSQKINTNRDAA